MIYIDDMAIFSDTREDHLKHIRNIFQMMRENQIYAKRKKCFFMKKELPYLGHIISEQGVSMDPAKIETMVNWPEIKSIKQLRAFLGLTGYYRRFIANYAQIAIPLTNLLKAETMNEWDDNCTKARNLLITTLTTAPLLVSPDSKAPFTVTTDASDMALGAVLAQNDKPVAFLSKTFSGAERNWIIYEKELFAIVYTLKKWEYHLLSNNLVTIVTDNNAITYIQNQAKITAKQARWLTYMAQFNYTIVHKPGAENKVADAISSQKTFLASPPSTTNTGFDRLRQLSAKIELLPWMNVRNGLIYKDNRLYIPGYNDIRKLIIEEHHQGFGGGHFGNKKTLEKITRITIGKRWQHQLTDSSNHATHAKGPKALPQKPFGLLSPIPPPLDKFQTLTIDSLDHSEPQPRGTMAS